MLSYLTQLIEWTSSLGALSLGALFLMSFLSAIFFVPRTALLIASGLVFGLIAAPIVLLGATAGGALAFWATRHVLKESAYRFVADRPRLQLVLNAIDKDGLWLLALLRFWGPVPASAQNYAFALTRVRMAPFVLISLICGAPQTLLYAYLGSIGGDLVRNRGMDAGPAALSAACTLSFIGATAWIVGRRVRSELAAAAQAKQPPRIAEG